MSISIASSAMLVELNISTWTARKLDKSVTEEVNTTKHASKQAARVNKNLLAGSSELERIHNLASEIHTWVRLRTMPWSDTGSRLIPTAGFFEFKEEMNKYEDEFDRRVGVFVQQYPNLIAGQAFKLGAMFSRNDFPSQDVIRGKFNFTLTFSPVPSAGDFRVDIGTEAEKALREQYEQAYNDRVDSAMDGIRQRLRTSLEHLSDRLGYEGGNKKVFRNSMIENLKQVLVSADLMNLVDDEELRETRDKVEQLIDSVTAKELRKNDHIREDVKSRVDGILDKFTF